LRNSIFIVGQSKMQLKSSVKNSTEIRGVTTKSTENQSMIHTQEDVKNKTKMVPTYKPDSELTEQELKQRMKNRSKRLRSSANKSARKKNLIMTTEKKTEKKISPFASVEKTQPTSNPIPKVDIPKNPGKTIPKKTEAVPKGNPTKLVKVKLFVPKEKIVKIQPSKPDPKSVVSQKNVVTKTTTSSRGMSRGGKVRGRGGKNVTHHSESAPIPMTSENSFRGTKSSDRGSTQKKTRGVSRMDVVESFSNRGSIPHSHNDTKSKKSVQIQHEHQREHMQEISTHLPTSNSLRGSSGRGRGRGRGRGSNVYRNREGVQVLSTSKPGDDTETIHYPKLTISALSKYDKSHEIWFQFRCAECNIWFWKMKHPLKAVAKHSESPKTNCQCGIKWDKLKKKECWGKGHFTCSRQGCGHVWTNDNSAFIFKQPCYKCGEKQFPVSLTPPPGEVVERDNVVWEVKKGERKTYRRHACEACDWGTTRPCTWWKIRTGAQKSDHHVSTGSTISTRASVIDAQMEYPTLMDNEIYSDVEE
jgi:hypothetical protein